MINNDVLLFTATNWETPYKHAAPTLLAEASTTRIYHQIKILRRRLQVLNPSCLVASAPKKRKEILAQESFSILQYLLGA